MKSLIADDSAAYRQLMIHLLSHYGPCDTVVDGAEALSATESAMAAGSPYDLICIDIDLPGPTVHEVLRAVRHRERSMGVPTSSRAKILVLTDSGSPRDVMGAFGCECDGYLVKPALQRVLPARLYGLGLVAAPQAAPMDHGFTGEIRKRVTDKVLTWSREHLGRGPASVGVFADDGILTVVVDGFMTKLEEELVKSNHARLVDHIRDSLLGSLKECVLAKFASESGQALRDLSGDCHPEVNRWVIVSLLERQG